MDRMLEVRQREKAGLPRRFCPGGRKGDGEVRRDGGRKALPVIRQQKGCLSPIDALAIASGMQG